MINGTPPSRVVRDAMFLKFGSGSERGEELRQPKVGKKRIEKFDFPQIRNIPSHD